MLSRVRFGSHTLQRVQIADEIMATIQAAAVHMQAAEAYARDATVNETLADLARNMCIANVQYGGLLLNFYRTLWTHDEE